MTCPVARFLEHFTNGDRAQFEIVANDRTRNPHLIAKSLALVDNAPPVTGTDLLKHQHETCDCFGFVD